MESNKGITGRYGNRIFRKIILDEITISRGDNMDLGHGFIKGRNKVSKQKIQFWLHIDYEINWKAFLWYMTQYITIVDYDESSFIVEIFSEEQREWFYKKVIEYSDDIGANNFSIDRTNDLYKTHNRGYQHNSHIIERLIAENI